VLATFALSAGVEASDTIFNAVFFVVVLSALAQGLTLEPIARQLALATEARPFYQPPLEIGVIQGLGGEILEYAVARTDAVAGSLVRDLALPPDAVVMLIVRAERGVPPRGSTRVEAGDRLYILATAATRDEVAELLRRWEDGPMPSPRSRHAPLAQETGSSVGGSPLRGSPETRTSGLGFGWLSLGKSPFPNEREEDVEESESRDIERMNPNEGVTQESVEEREGAEDEAREREGSMEESGGELPG
jgi:hypothetical protein